MTGRMKRLLPRRAAWVVFAVTMLAFATAGEPVPGHEVGGMPEVGYWERMVINIGLAATLALINAATIGWLIRYTLRASDDREKRMEITQSKLLNELSEQRIRHAVDTDAQREAFRQALSKLTDRCPLEVGPGHVPRHILERLDDPSHQLRSRESGGQPRDH